MKKTNFWPIFSTFAGKFPVVAVDLFSWILCSLRNQSWTQINKRNHFFFFCGEGWEFSVKELICTTSINIKELLKIEELRVMPWYIRLWLRPFSGTAHMRASLMKGRTYANFKWVQCTLGPSLCDWFEQSLTAWVFLVSSLTIHLSTCSALIFYNYKSTQHE